MHSGERSNKCNQCDFASSIVVNLRGHLKIHSGEKTNKCNQCDNASACAGALRIHLKTHYWEKTNKCNQCDYALPEAGQLRRFLKTHGGEKTNKCNQCKYAIRHSMTQATSGNIWKHILEKYQTNVSDFASCRSCNLRTYLKNHTPHILKQPLTYCL